MAIFESCQYCSQWTIYISNVTLLQILLSYYYYYYYVSRHKCFLPDTSLLEPTVIPAAQASKFRTTVLSVLCLTFQVQMSFIVNLPNVYLAWFPNFSLKLLLPFRWLQLSPLSSYISGSTFVVPPYMNSCILLYYYYYYYYYYHHHHHHLLYAGYLYLYSRDKLCP